MTNRANCGILPAMGDGDDSDEPVRMSWFGMNQPRPKLPYYFHTKKRLRSLDEFEPPAWKGLGWSSDETRVTVRGVARDTLRWLAIFAIASIIVGSAWRAAFGSVICAEVIAGFKVGWC
jgi:hypothetical protein